MRIFIPTYQRGPERQYTVRELGPLAKRYRATLVCPPAELQGFHKAGFMAVACRAKGIAATRQWILDKSDDPLVLMLDDDLSSWSWRNDELEEGQVVATRYKKATDQERAAGLRQVADLLKRFSHGSIGHRLFANNRAPLDFNTRQLRALAYNRDVLKREKITFRLPVMEDFDVQLQMLKRGHECFQVNTLVQEQNGSNINGGCSTYRTAKVQEKAARELARLHPECVTVVEKKLKESENMWADRVDVRVSWRNAISTGLMYQKARRVL